MLIIQVDIAFKFLAREHHTFLIEHWMQDRYKLRTSTIESDTSQQL